MPRILKALQAALDKEGATFEIIAPKVGGAKASDGSWIEADQMIDGAPIGVVRRGRAAAGSRPRWMICCRNRTARDFVADAFAHCKFIGYVEAATPLFEKAGIAEADFDEGLHCARSQKMPPALSKNSASCAFGAASPASR